MNAPITSASFPNGLPPLRSEENVRALAKARIEAWASFDRHMAIDRPTFTEDQKVEWEIERARLWNAACKAGAALLLAPEVSA